MKSLKLILAIATSLCAQGLDPALLTKSDTSMWATHYGDYSGRRYSQLLADKSRQRWLNDSRVDLQDRPRDHSDV